MKKGIIVVLCLFVLGIAQSIQATSVQFAGYRFEAYVVTHQRGHLPEYHQGSRNLLKVYEGEEYSIIIQNPLPVRVAVAISIDGLNTIDGKRSRPEKASKWIIEAYSSLTLRGWQTGSKSLRRFIFTREKESYAVWKERFDGKNYRQNLGVIGIAYFWDSRELYQILNPPQPFAACESESKGKEALSSRKLGYSERSKSEDKAGTGMGRYEHHRVEKIDFYYDTGMYANADVLKIYYEFAKSCEPKPFADDDEGFAPDMTGWKGHKR